MESLMRAHLDANCYWGEFKSDGDSLDHVIKSGPNEGKINKKQVWGKCTVHCLPQH